MVIELGELAADPRRCEQAAGGTDGGRPLFWGEELLKEPEGEAGVGSLPHTVVELGITFLKIYAQNLSVFKKHMTCDLDILLLGIYPVNKCILTIHIMPTVAFFLVRTIKNGNNQKVH